MKKEKKETEGQRLLRFNKEISEAAEKIFKYISPMISEEPAIVLQTLMELGVVARMCFRDLCELRDKKEIFEKITSHLSQLHDAQVEEAENKPKMH